MDDAKEEVQAMKGEHYWSINPIILDTKALDSLFCFMDFDYILMTLNGQYMHAKFCYSAWNDVGYEREISGIFSGG